MIFSAVIPCSFFDQCEDNVTEHQECAKDEQECKGCSPFSICSPQQGYAYSTTSYSIVLGSTNSRTDYNKFIVGSESDYHPSLLQPPRC